MLTELNYSQLKSTVEGLSSKVGNYSALKHLLASILPEVL